MYILRGGPRNMKKTIWQFIGTLFTLISVVAFVTLSTHPVLAQNPPSAQIAQIGSCESDESGLTSILSKLVPAGDIYIRSTIPGTQQNLRIYAQPIDEASCVLLGKTDANDKTWSRVGKLSADLTQKPFGFVIYGSQASSNPYQAVESLLIVTDSNLCKPEKDCTVDYNAQSGTLEPIKYSSASDQIIVSVAEPLKDPYTSVDYYVDGRFVYSNTKLEAISLNYLS